MQQTWFKFIRQTLAACLLTAAYANAATIAQPTIDNLADQTWLLIVSTLNASGKDGKVQYMPMRDVYFFGAGGTVQVSADYTVSGTEGVVNVNASGGSATIQMPPLSTITNQRLRIQKHLLDTSSNTITVQLAAGDAVTDGDGTWTTKVLTHPGDFVFFPGV